MCIDPVGDRTLETIPIEDAIRAIFDPVDRGGSIDDQITVEFGPNGFFINVPWPGGLGVFDAKRGGRGKGKSGPNDPNVIRIGQEWPQPPPSAGTVGVPQDIPGRNKDTQVEPPVESKVGVIAWAVGRALRGILGLGG